MIRRLRSSTLTSEALDGLFQTNPEQPWTLQKINSSISYYLITLSTCCNVIGCVILGRSMPPRNQPLARASSIPDTRKSEEHEKDTDRR